MAQRILIAEDNDRVAAFVEALLRHEGYTTERTADGIETLQRIGRSVPDLLLLDLRLPRLHGVDLLKKLRKSPVGNDLPVIIVTGVYRGERYARAAQSLGVRHYLEKPFSANALLAAVKDMLPSCVQVDAAPEEGEPFDRHLYQAFSTGFSGTFHFEGKRKATLSFIAGTPVSLRPGFRHRDFGDYLLQNGRISANEYDYYQGAGHFRSDVLVQLGCLRYPELLQEKLAYLTGELLEAFSGPPLKVEQRSFPLSPGLQLFTLNMPSLFHRGYWRSSAPDTANPFPEEVYGQFVAPAAAFYRHVNFLDLNEEERRFVSQLDGSRTMAACLEGASGITPLLRLLKTFGMLVFAHEPLSVEMPAGMPLRLLFNVLEDETGPGGDGPLESFSDLVNEESRDDEPLLPAEPPPVLPEIGDLSLRVRQVFEGMQGKNYYQIFAMEQGKFSFDQLKTHYFKLTREFGPETMMQLAGEEAGMVEDILATVTTAYNTLSDVIKKERYDELLGSEKVGLGQKGDDIFQAQVQFQSGKVFLDMEEWDNAEKALQDACNIAPKNGDYLAHLAWSIYRNPQHGSSPAMREKVRQTLNRALTLDRVPSAYAFKGWILLEGGQDLLAEAEFSKALKLDARNNLARKGLREITEKREQEKKGLFRRMFS
ncbi:response regulator [Desulfuromonas sp. AOP6]|uniref:response regulator n=1 Tax=Desulfuromonas sp. AOP6 TaxID=1566351 RepID=UPI00127DCDCE|nr:response regulator [Desulfuromonas sp. AOP6]BCA78480.1 hypothetical protein AOP6_0267 [Desulfuromonas sp. AOP6]